MPPSRTSSIASSHRRYEGDIESSDDPHEVESPIEERPQTHANRAMKHELGDVTPRPPLRGFASSEKVLPVPPPLLPSHHSAPSALPSAAASVLSISAPSEPTPTVPVAAPPLPPLPCPLPASVRLLRPAPLYPSTRNCPCGYTHAHRSTIAMILSSSISWTQARSAMSMRSNAGGRTVKTAQNCRRTERGRGRRSSVRGMCLEMFPQRRCRVVARDFRETVTGTSTCRRACEWVGGLALASSTIGSCQGQSAQRSVCASEKCQTNIHWRTGNCTAV
jgi:hypothetical protein